MEITRREMTALLASVAGLNAESRSTVPQPVAFDSMEMSGDLAKRSGQNFDRLETPYYEPPQVFQDDSQKWPGDIEGRTVLALTLLSRGTHRKAMFLDEILKQYSGEDE